jgi:hypothetical protein
MNSLRLFLILTITAGAIVVATSVSSARSARLSAGSKSQVASSIAIGTAELERELKLAHSATAKYNTVKQAEADGYIQDVYLSGEGLHYFNPEFYDDGVFDIEHPEVLLYVPDDHGTLHLAALEYLVPYDPNAPIPPAPEGFTGNEDEWRAGQEGFPEWALNAWVWTYNPEGVFSHDNPLVP